MRSPGIKGEGELRGQPANPNSPGKMAVKTESVCVYFPPAEGFPLEFSNGGELKN